MDLNQPAETGVVMAIKAAPPVTVAGVNLVGIPLPDLVQWVTLIYVLVLAGHQTWKWHREWKVAKKEDGESA
jgi:hypothetical protein